MSKWVNKKLGEIADIIVSNVDKHINPHEQKVYLCNYMDAYKNRYIKKTIDFSEGSANAEEKRKYSLMLGDVLITKDSETPDDIGIPAIIWDSIDNLVCGYHLAILRPKSDIDSLFLMHLLQSDHVYKNWGTKASGATRYGLSKGAISSANLHIPAKIKEQSKIAEVLTTIDIAIEQTEICIKKYSGIKQGLMQDLLTNGMDENGKIRSPKTHKYKSSILGMIPEEWMCVEFSKVCRVRQGLQIAIANRSIDKLDDSYFLYITVDYLNSGRNEYYIKNPPKSVICTEKDILMTRTGNTGTVVTNIKGVFHNNFFLVDFDRNKLEKEYVFMYLNRKEIKNMFINYSGVTTIPDLKHKDFYNTFIKFPKSKKEQLAIIQNINSVEQQISIEDAYLKKLVAIKKGLMQDLLTGNISVDILLEGVH